MNCSLFWVQPSYAHDGTKNKFTIYLFFWAFSPRNTFNEFICDSFSHLRWEPVGLGLSATDRVRKSESFKRCVYMPTTVAKIWLDNHCLGEGFSEHSISLSSALPSSVKDHLVRGRCSTVPCNPRRWCSGSGSRSPCPHTRRTAHPSPGSWGCTLEQRH